MQATRVLFAGWMCCTVLLGVAHGQKELNDECDRAGRLLVAGRVNEAAGWLRELLARPIAEDSVRAKAYFHYGSCQKGLNQLDSGLYFLRKAADIWHAKGSRQNLFRAYANMAGLLATKTDYREPIKFYNDALRYAGSKTDSLTAYIRICALFLQNGLFDSAYRLVQTRIGKYTDAESNAIAYKLYYTELARGKYFKEKKDYAEAIRYMLKAATCPVPDSRYRADIFTEMAGVFLEAENFKEAFRYTDSAERMMGTSGWEETRLHVYDLYANLHEATGNYAKALEYTRLAQELDDSFYVAEENKALIETAERYKNEIIEAEKAVAEKDRDIMRRNWAFTGVALLLAAALAVLFLRNARIRKKANRELAQQKQQLQALADQLAVANDTKARLFSTIGHDLRSPVSSLYASLKMQEVKNKADSSMSRHTIGLLDTLEDLLAWSKSQMDGFVVQPVKVDLRNLLEEVRQFYAVPAAAKNLVLANEAVPRTVVRTDENLLKTILRNAVSNAVANTEPGNTVQLSAGTSNDGAVTLSIANPCGEAAFRRFEDSYNQAAIKGANGLGTVLIKEFAQKIGATVQLSYTNGNAVLLLSF